MTVRPQIDYRMTDAITQFRSFGGGVFWWRLVSASTTNHSDGDGEDGDHEHAPVPRRVGCRLSEF